MVVYCLHSDNCLILWYTLCQQCIVVHAMFTEIYVNSPIMCSSCQCTQGKESLSNNTNNAEECSISL